MGWGHKFFAFFLTTTIIVLTTRIHEVVGVLGADPGSLQKIIAGLCSPQSRHDENFANGFYGCYSLLDEKEKCIFDKCQIMSFGCTLHTKANIEHSCTVPEKLPIYINCLMTRFKECGRDFVPAVTTINMCQGRLLGIE